MAVQKIEGKLIGIFISTVLANPQPADWKEVVCSTDISIDGTLEGGQTIVTRCGTLKSKGTPSWSFPVSGVANSAPVAGQISADELIDMFQEGDDFLVKLVHTDGDNLYYRQGQGFFNGYTESIPAEGAVTFDGTIDIEGKLTLVP